MKKRFLARTYYVLRQCTSFYFVCFTRMRRAGMFEQALKLAEDTKSKDIEEIIMQVITYEESLIESKDIDSHTVSEALDYK